MQEHNDDTNDQALSDWYAELSREQPPEAMDEKILAEAHGAVASDVVGAHASFKRENSASPFSGRWTVPVSLAAVIVLSVVVVTMIEKKRPYSITSLPEPVGVEQSRPEARTVEREIAQKDVQKEKAQAATEERKKEQKEQQKEERKQPKQKAERVLPRQATVGRDSEQLEKAPASRLAPVAKLKTPAPAMEVEPKLRAIPAEEKVKDDVMRDTRHKQAQKQVQIEKQPMITKRLLSQESAADIASVEDDEDIDKAERKPVVAARRVAPASASSPPLPQQQAAESGGKPLLRAEAEQSAPVAAEEGKRQPGLSPAAPAADESAPAEAAPAETGSLQAGEETGKVLANNETAKAVANISGTTNTETDNTEAEEPAAADESLALKEESTAVSASPVKQEEEKVIESRQIPAESQAPVEQQLGILAEQQTEQQIEPQAESLVASPAAAARLVAPQSVAALSSASGELEACDSLAMADCLKTSECTLQRNDDDKGYQCRKSANACESGFSQLTGSQQSCLATPGCKFIASDCFCPPGAKCECSGGSPPMCVPE